MFATRWERGVLVHLDFVSETRLPMNQALRPSGWLLSLHRTNLVWSAVIRLWRLYLVKAGPFPSKARVCGVS